MNHAEIAELLLRFRQECSREPLYAALCEVAAADERARALLAEAPPAQRKANLLLATLHDHVLAGAAPALAAYYPSVGGTRAPDAGLAVALSACLDAHWPTLVEQLRHGATQTNEIGRCAVIWPALGAVADATGRDALALLDFGCSAGLNLVVDAYALRYRLDDGSLQPRGAPADGQRAEIDARWLGAAPPPAAQARWQLVQRDGVDPAPVDLHDPARLRWLQACLWPQDAARRQRLERAARQMRALPHRLQRASDCIAAIAPWLATLPAGVQPVLLTSWVLYYLQPDELQRLRDTVEALSASHGLAWICGDLPALAARSAAALPPPPPLTGDDAAGSQTLWTLRLGGQERALAWSHPHGRWVAWLG